MFINKLQRIMQPKINCAFPYFQTTRLNAHIQRFQSAT